MKTISKEERFDKAMISLSRRQIVFPENANFDNDATTTTNYSNSLDTRTTDFRWVLPFLIVFIVFRVDDAVAMCTCNIVVALYSCKRGLVLDIA